MPLDDPSLSEAFATLTADGGERHPPFRWQKRLLARLLCGELPESVDVPTGLGKTAVMALWLIGLAKGARIPRRLVYVVDRRAVVDQATRYAERLRKNLPADLAKALRIDSRHGGLPVSTLRGGLADNRVWLEDPSSPAIIVGTVDMIGSRLMFEGYGVSKRMRPYYAGLLGVDALLLLDEAHLCPPFEALLRQVAEHRAGELGPLGKTTPHTPPFRLVSLSATGRGSGGSTERGAFRLEAEDCEEPIVRARLRARKRLRIHDVDDHRKLAERLADRALEISASAEAAVVRVLVYCNSRKTAVDVKSRIDKDCRRRSRAVGKSFGWASELLVGERRIHERAELECWLERRGFLGGSRPDQDGPVFLVATSAGEVGVDLDADHLVCDLVPYERMVQRLGRVNRRGGAERTATVDVFAVRPSRSRSTGRTADRAKDEAQRFERWLAPLRALEPGEDDRLDASPAATVQLRSDLPDVVRAATTPAPLHPELTRPLLDAWAMTSLDRHEGRPEVAPWLRGWEDDEEAETIVVWRSHLPRVRAGEDVSAPPGMVTDYFRAAPIHATEKLEAGSRRVLDWLLKRAVRVTKRGEDHVSSIRDDEIVAILLDRKCRSAGSGKLALLQCLAAPAKALNKTEKTVRDRLKKDWEKSVLPGAILVVDARLGGLRDGMLTEREEETAIAADSDASWQALREEPTPDASPVIKFRAEEVSAGDDGEGLTVSGHTATWRLMQTFETRSDGAGKPLRGLAVSKWANEAVNEEARSVGPEFQVLSQHTQQVVDRVLSIAKRLDLPDDEVEALKMAARLHDGGKAAHRWQSYANAPPDGRVYAKTPRSGSWLLLDGYRHEFGSLIRAEGEDLPNGLRDLILHLIASHHGRARPIIRPDGCDGGPPSLFEQKAGEAALRFARLQRRYGPWGLAWREAILRAADQSASRSGLSEGRGTDG